MNTVFADNNTGFLPSPIPTERWKSAPHLQGRYEVSDHGRVRALNLHLNEPKMTYPNMYEHGNSGVLGFSVSQKATTGNAGRVRLHLLVLEAFCGPCPPEHQAHWVDGDKRNNKLSNLQWRGKADINQERAKDAQDKLEEEDSESNHFHTASADLQQRLSRAPRKTILEQFIADVNQASTEMEEELRMRQVCAGIRLPSSRRIVESKLVCSSTSGKVAVLYQTLLRDGHCVAEQYTLDRATFHLCNATELAALIQVYVQWTFETSVLPRLYH